MSVQILAPVRNIGRLSLYSVRSMGRMAIFLARAIGCMLTSRMKLSLVLQRIHFIGAQSVLVIVLTGGITGMVLGFQGYYALSKFGSDAFLGPMVALGLIKELGPVIAALMVTGRAGSAVTAELGILRIGEQIDALELMGLRPFRYLVVPNLVAAVLCMPLLVGIFDVVGVAGGYLVGVRLMGVSPGVYFGEMTQDIVEADVVQGFWKSVSFGALIGWVCCYKGYYAQVTARGVSQATTEAVVLTSVLILSWDCFLTAVL